MKYERISKDWGKMGFQGKDPKTDFRGAGYFGLCNLIYFAKNYNEKYKSMLKGRSTEELSNYPVAIASLNVVMLIYQILGIFFFFFTFFFFILKNKFPPFFF